MFWHVYAHEEQEPGALGHGTHTRTTSALPEAAMNGKSYLRHDPPLTTRQRNGSVFRGPLQSSASSPPRHREHTGATGPALDPQIHRAALAGARPTDVQVEYPRHAGFAGTSRFPIECGRDGGQRRRSLHFSARLHPFDRRRGQNEILVFMFCAVPMGHWRTVRQPAAVSLEKAGKTGTAAALQTACDRMVAWKLKSPADAGKIWICANCSRNCYLKSCVVNTQLHALTPTNAAGLPPR